MTTRRDDIRAKIERSSLGTKDARQARARITDADARKVVSRAAAYPRAMPAKKNGG